MTYRFLMLLLTLVVGTSGMNAYNETTWTGTSPSDAAASTDANVKTVYLYNVGKKMFLGEGGNWGVEALLSDVGAAYQISTTEYGGFTFHQAEGSGYLCPTSKEKDEKYKLYFLTAHFDSYGFDLIETSTGSGQYRISFDEGSYYMVATSVDGTTAGADENHRICIMA